MDTTRSASGARDRSARESVSRVVWLASSSVAATVLVFMPVLLRSPSTTQPPPTGWLVALILAAPLTAYLVSRRLGPPLNVTSAFLVGLPQVPLFVLLSVASIWLDVQRGHLLAGSGEEAMSYGIGATVSAVAGIVLLILVSVAAKFGSRRRVAKE